MTTTFFLRRSARQILLAAGICFLFPFALVAQNTYKISTGNDVNINVSGKSNVHDWTMKSKVMESHGDFKFDASNKLSSISSFSFDLESKSLKSGKSSMDSRTYKSMKAEKYPKILYKLKTAVITQLQKNKYLVKSTGDLTIAGATQNIAMDLNMVINPDNTISCTGSEKIKLTDYKIDPPSFMLGAMKVYNDLTIQFNLLYKK